MTSKTLARLAKHPYGVIRENVARHPNADPATLSWLSRDRSQPLWYLVAFNPNTPAALRRKLQGAAAQAGAKAPSASSRIKAANRYTYTRSTPCSM